MRQQSSDRVMLNDVGCMILRVLIGSYFMAVALQIIPGTDLSVLFATILPTPTDDMLSAGLVFILAFMVMIGMHTRAAALVLGLMTFFASYLAMIQMGVAEELGAFWRDLALIAALILTYTENDPRNINRVRVVRRKIEPRRLKLSDGAPRGGRPMLRNASPVAERLASRTRLDTLDRVDRIDNDMDNLFADLHRGA